MILQKYRQTIRFLFSNRDRFSFTIAGIVIPLLLFLLFSEITETFSGKEYRDLLAMGDDTVMIRSASGMDLHEAFLTLDRNRIPYQYTLVRETDLVFQKEVLYRNQRTFVSLHPSLIQGRMENGYLPYEKESVFSRSPVRFLYGKDFSGPDDQEARTSGNSTLPCIMEKSTARLLFGTENAIGKELPVSASGIILSVWGIIEDLPSAAEKNLKINCMSAALITERTLYLPDRSNVLSLFEEEGLDPERRKDSVTFRFSKDQKETGRHLLEQTDLKTGDCEVTDRKSLLEDTKEFYQGVNSAASLLLMLLLIFSGLMIMNTMCFSIRERTAEIGIRRALGAGPGQIIQQFLAEGIVIGIFSAFLAAAAASFLLSAGSVFLLYVEGIPFLLTLHIKTVLLSLFFSVTEALLFSVPPALQAAKLEPAQALYT